MVHARVEARYGATLAEALDDLALSRETVELEMTRSAMLERLTRRLASAPDEEQILREGLDAVFALTGAQLAAVTCASSDGSEWTTLAASACATEEARWQKLQEKMAAAAESLGLHPDWEKETSFRIVDVARDGRGRIGDQGLQSFIAVPIVGDGQILGLTCAASLQTDAFSKQDIQALATLASSQYVALQNVRRRRTLEDLNLQVIACFGAVLGARDHYSYGHSEDDARYAVALAEEMGLSPEQVRNIQIGALLHDIGKIGVPDEILNKIGRLAEEEFEEVKEHPALGASIVAGIEQLHSVVPIIRHHHERFDGSGYPDGLAGEDIPLEARVLAVADTFGAMTDDRAYHQALTLEQVIAELEACAGSQLDPQAVRAFLRLLRRKGDQLLSQRERARKETSLRRA